MVYSFLKVLVGAVLKLFFRKIYITGTENIRHGQAQLVVSNHPSGFMEPLIMACFFPKDLYFLVRGDVFDNPVLKPLLIATHQIPIYRFRDGFSKLRNNNQTVDASVDVLKNRNSLLIFAEGSTKSMRMVRPLQKGLARIAIQTKNQIPDMELEIVPVGINFAHPTAFRREVFLRIGKPIPAEKFFDEKIESSKPEHDALLQAVQKEMIPHVIHLENQERSKIAELLFRVFWRSPGESVRPVMESDLKKLDFMKNIATALDNTSEDDLAVIQSTVKDTEKSLKKSRITLDDLHKIKAGSGNYLILLAGFLPSAFGYVFNFIPVIMGMWFTKLKVKQKEFKSSVLMVSCFTLLLLWYLGWIIFSFITPQFWILPFTGFVSGLIFLDYMEYFRRFAIFEDLHKINEGRNIMTQIVSQLGVSLPDSYK